MRKISIIGAGQVGSQAAACTIQRGLGAVTLIDVLPGLARGRALDIAQAQAVRGAGPVSIEGSDQLSASADSDIVVITAGQARTPGMSRSDLLTRNASIVTEVVRQAVRWSPDCLLVVVTNPINSLVQLALEVSGFAPQRVIGMAGILDNARLRWALAQALGVGTDAVSSWVIGDHGDFMVPVLSQTTAHGKPINRCLDAGQLAEAVTRARQGGTEIVEALRTGSASYAPGQAIAELLAGLVGQQPAALCCSCYLQGEYGVTGLYVGVAAEVGPEGVRRISQFPLDDLEQEQFRAAVEHIRTRNSRLST